MCARRCGQRGTTVGGQATVNLANLPLKSAGGDGE